VILPLSFSLVLLAAYLWHQFSGNMMVPSMFVRRVFFVPAQLTFAYFEFFDDHPFVLWSNSFFSGLLEYPYDVSIGALVGQYVESSGNANNGYVSSGFAHAGVWGVLAYTIVIGAILRFLNVLGRSGVPLWFAIALTIVPLRAALISSDLLTALLTHGLLVAMVLLILMRANA
jgi:hypothetical protein